MFDVYVGFGWIFRRLVLHFSVIVPTMILCSYYIGGLYSAVVFTFLLLVYGALTWGQIRNPLISASINKMKITNLFHFGVKEFKVSSINQLFISGEKLIVVAGEERVVVPLSGVSKESNVLLQRLCESM